MSAVALQRVVVRMLFDPPFSERIFAGECVDGVTDEEHEWLRSADSRAFRIDPYRRSRALAALMEEFPVASALAVRGPGVPALDAFFSSELFHAGMQSGSSLSVLYPDYLNALELPTYGSLLLESAMARLRRAGPRAPAAGYALAAGVVALELPGGTLALYEDVLEQLLRDGRPPLEIIMDTERELRLPETDSDSGSDLLLLQKAEDDSARIERLPAALFEILSACESGIGRDDLLSRFAAHDADEAEADEVLEELLSSGVLVRS